MDLSAMPATQREAATAAQVLEERQRPFDLARGPLFRPSLLRLAEDEHVLMLSMHHIISDEWSMQILNRELSALYSAYRDGQPRPKDGETEYQPRPKDGETEYRPSPLADLPIQYADVSAWQREWLQGETLQKQLAYWQEQLSGAPATLDLLTDRPRPALQTHRGAAETSQMAATLFTSLSTLGRTQRATPFMAALAAYALLLHRYTGQHDIVIGTPIANRQRVEWEGLIGFFVNTLVLRVDLSGNPTFRELLARVREMALDAYDHQDLPFEKLVEELGPERTLSHTPLFQVMFSMQTVPQTPLQLPGLEVLPLHSDNAVARFDLSLNLANTQNTVSARLLYNTDLFDRATIERMLSHYGTLLQSIVSDPEQRIGRLQLLTSVDRQQLLVDWNQTHGEFAPALMHERFAVQATSTPQAEAVSYGGQSLTYGELNARSNQLAHYLIHRGVGPETLVGICMEPSPNMVVAVLGVFKAGAAYVPIDPLYPDERVHLLVDDTRAAAVITQETLQARFRELSAHVLCLDAAGDALACESTANPPPSTAPENLAYLIYTSGSTGKPKGVMLEHRNLANFLSWVNSYLVPGGQPAMPFTTRLSFDACLKQLLAPLICGKSVWVVPSETITDPNELLAALNSRDGVSLGCVPTLWKALLTAMEQNAQLRLGPGFTHVFLGGEALDPDTVQRTRDLLPHVEMWNLYGPTEATPNAAAGPLRDDGRIMIGRPIANARLYILDHNGEPSPVGVPGELYIGGAGVGRGYWQRPDLTAASLVPDPFADLPGQRLYRTGDLCRYAPDGRIEFLGRMDNQVKLHGYRIELGEIEHALRQHPAVREAIVLLLDFPPFPVKDAGWSTEDKHLVGYVVPSQQPPPRHELLGFLQKTLPQYMIPAHIVFLDELPRMPSGKVDRRALPRPDETSLHETARFVAPRTPLEELVAGIWAELLGLPRVGVHDDFFELGGHSLLATQVIARLRSTLGVAVPVRTIFETPTVAGLAIAILERLARPGERTTNQGHEELPNG